MPRREISGFLAHPDREQFAAYLFNSPLGTWTARLDYIAWGKSGNLLCYFTSETDGGKYRLSTFWNSQYRPQRSGPEFDKETPGSRYQLTLEASRAGLAKFVQAERIL